MGFMKMFSFSSLLIAQPTGMWESIIFAFETFIPSYAWAIIVFTMILKLILSPMDYFNKSFARKNARMQKLLQPEMDALQQKYGNDKDMLNRKTMELYQKNNFNVVGSCGIMFVNLILTFVIFITLFSGLNAVAKFKIEEQYLELKTVYEQVMVETSNNTEVANDAVKAKYDEISQKYSWLWIKNVWQSDQPFTSNILTFDEYNNIVKMESAAAENERATYELVMNPLREQVGGPNGYLILVLFAVGISFAAQKVSQLTIRRENGVLRFVNDKVEVVQGPAKTMLWMLPVLMGVITYTTNSVFGLYVIASSLFGLITTPLINVIVDKMEERQVSKQLDQNKPTYSR